MMKLSREQIIKVLECCWYEKDCVGDECPLFEPISDCAPLIAMGALDLIKELTEENEKLKSELLKIIEQDIPALCAKEMLNTHTAAVMKLGYESGVRNMQEKILSQSEYGTINISPWQLDQIAKEVLEVIS